jgi:hypothetical protein
MLFYGAVPVEFLFPHPVDLSFSIRYLRWESLSGSKPFLRQRNASQLSHLMSQVRDATSYAVRAPLLMMRKISSRRLE